MNGYKSLVYARSREEEATANGAAALKKRRGIERPDQSNVVPGTRAGKKGRKTNIKLGMAPAQRPNAGRNTVTHGLVSSSDLLVGSAFGHAGRPRGCVTRNS